ncbi:pentatricopeptide repeat-containing protein At4g25270, chloroplastic [Beta vulgaris subsp. vulgaris]|uniref:pentatricopeptide repeat-containing protein At4g25270, chloroplastic n=1 Tax=Beta vulgaris subsp. vulgaris TaxID=3555 RepID=UPI002036CBF5|nr:pentatricopeptide repeat-containing protein At4g25270, chloroplastic [Beta vulgaris subsp. vulgaris]
MFRAQTIIAWLRICHQNYKISIFTSHKKRSKIRQRVSFVLVSPTKMLATSPASTPINFCSLTITSSLPDKIKKPRKLKNRKHKNPHLIHPNKGNNLSFPASSSNPVLQIKQLPENQTQIVALDAVVNDLEEAFLKNGVIVETQTFSSLLETCFRLKAVDHGVRIHRLIPRKILSQNVGVVSKLLRLYAANGRVEEAHQLFDEMPKRNESAFAWNSLISGYAELGMFEDALALYFQMEEEGVEPDRHTFPRALMACSGIGSICVGEELHRHVVRCGFYSDVFVLNALVDMYAKCGDIVKSRKVFDKIACKDLVSWNSMILGYIHHELLAKAIEIFHDMLKAGFEPDHVTISKVVSKISSLRIGTQIHGWVLRRGLEWSLPITNSFIVFYSNHGLLDQCRWLFSHIPEKDIISWNSIISAHRNDHQVLTYFEQMENTGVTPDAITFVSLLSACAHLGLVKEGESVFSLMINEYAITPIMEHYACLVNLYGRAGLIYEAYDIIASTMEFEAGPTVWGALLYACFLHSNAEIGELAAQQLFELEPDNERNFELLIRIYDNLGRPEDSERVRKMMEDRGLD